MKTKFKTFIFKGDRTKILGNYAIFGVQGEKDNDWYGSETPRLMPMTATIETFKEMYPKADLKDIKLITVELNQQP